MKEKLGRNKYIILILVIILGAFYWYEIKPSQIEAECSGFAFSALEIGLETNDAKGLFDIMYDTCMRNGGVDNIREIIKEAIE